MCSLQNFQTRVIFCVDSMVLWQSMHQWHQGNKEGLFKMTLPNHNKKENLHVVYNSWDVLYKFPRVYCRLETASVLLYNPN